MQLHMPVVPTQGVYRELLNAISHPGRLCQIPTEDWPTLLDAVCETLLDHEVTFHVLNGAPEELDGEIFARTKARRASLETADYLVVAGHTSDGRLESVKRGNPPFPDQSATVFYVMAQPFSQTGLGAPVLTGPGIRDEMRVSVNPLAPQEWALLHELNAEYPLGVDVFCLIGERQVMAIPRSTRWTQE